MEEAFTPIELPAGPGENKALIDAFITRYQSCYDDMLADDLTRQLAKHIKGEGKSMLQPVVWQTCTPYFASNAKNPNEMEEMVQKINDDPYRARKITTDDLAKYFEGVTSVRAMRLIMQVFPELWVSQSEPLDQDHAVLYDPECNLYNREYNLEGVVCKWLDDAEVPHMQFFNEILTRNQYFLNALKDACSKGFYLKREQRDGWVGDKAMCVPLPDYCKYSTKQDYISEEDILWIVAAMQENSFELRRTKKPVMLMSPRTAAMMINNTTMQSQDRFMCGFYSKKGAPKHSSYWIDFFQSVCVPDNKAYVLIPGCTVGFFDWGTRTQVREPRILPDDPKKRKVYEGFGEQDDATVQFRRLHETKTCVIEPRAFMEITIK